MAFRKCDLKKVCTFYFPVIDWSEEVKQTVPREEGLQEVLLLTESSRRRSELQLPPDKIRLHDIIVSGNVIDPTNALQSLSPSDVSDLEDDRERFSSEMYEYLKNNEGIYIKE